jgi:hypothetical protein
MITISQNQSVKVDDSDYDYLNQYKWHLTSKGYAARRVHYPSTRANQVAKIFLMHRILAFADRGYQVDHINGDKLDNQKSNLRLCNASQNQSNRRLQSNNTSGYKGVHYNKPQNNWRARVVVNRKTINLGGFSTPELAAEAYNLKAKELHGEFALLNDITLTPTTSTARQIA